MLKQITIIAAVVLLLLALPSCVDENAGTITFQVGILHKGHRLDPMVRQTFHLLDEDVEFIIKGYVVNKSKPPIYYYGWSEIYKLSDETGLREKIKAAVRSHTIQSVTTDYDGRGIFKGLKPEETYYIVGASRDTDHELLSYFLVWNIEAKTGSTKLLYQENAEHFTWQ
jgi:hypothetical protein